MRLVFVSRFDGVAPVRPPLSRRRRRVDGVEATKTTSTPSRRPDDTKGRRNGTDDVLEDGLLLRVAFHVLLGRVGEHARRRPVLRRDDEFRGRAHAVKNLVVVAAELSSIKNDARARDLLP